MSQLADKMKVPNPHHPGAPARMADGRLFTDYRGNGTLLTPLGFRPFAEFERRGTMIATGDAATAGDRSIATLRAASTGCVDTMVPELDKRVYTNRSVERLPNHAVGIGSGRFYLPKSQSGLIGGDPDYLAAATFPAIPGVFSANPNLYVPAPATVTKPVGPYNRYSAPYN